MPDRPARKPFLARVLAPAAAAAGPLCAGAAALGVVTAILLRPSEGPVRAAGPEAPPAGHLRVVLPSGAVAHELGVTLLRMGETAVSSEGRRIARIWPDSLARCSLEPGVYVLRLSYRERPLPDRTVHIRSNERADVRPLPAELAAIEYRAGLLRAREPGGADLPYFRRTLRMRPRHVDAHLQLAAAALAQGFAGQAAYHVRIVKRVDPGNADAGELAALIARVRRGRR